VHSVQTPAPAPGHALQLLSSHSTKRVRLYQIKKLLEQEVEPASEYVPAAQAVQELESKKKLASHFEQVPVPAAVQASQLESSQATQSPAAA